MRGMKFFTNIIRGTKIMGDLEKILWAGTRPDKCPTPNPRQKRVWIHVTMALNALAFSLELSFRIVFNW